MVYDPFPALRVDERPLLLRIIDFGDGSSCEVMKQTYRGLSILSKYTMLPKPICNHAQQKSGGDERLSATKRMLQEALTAGWQKQANSGENPR